MQAPETTISASTPLPAADPHAPSVTRIKPERVPPETRDRVLRSANWFFWIAGLSLINSMVSLAGGQWHFVLGLGFTEVADAAAAYFGGYFVVLALVFDLLAAAVFVGFGVLAHRMVLWPFVVGLVLYTLDAGLVLFAGDYLSAAFHGYALYCIFLGVDALWDYRAARA